MPSQLHLGSPGGDQHLSLHLPSPQLYQPIYYGLHKMSKRGAGEVVYFSQTTASRFFCYYRKGGKGERGDLYIG